MIKLQNKFRLFDRKAVLVMIWKENVMISQPMLKVDTRCLDDLGRVMIPKVLRARYDLSEGDELSVYDTGDSIVLRKSRSSCCMCHSLENLIPVGDNRYICAACIETIQKLSV